MRALARRPPALVAALALALGLGCSTADSPVHAPLLERSARRPVVLVPGVTGAALRDRATGRVIWGRGADLLKPRDGGYAVARPLSTDETGESGAEPIEVIEEIRLLGGLIRKPVYGPVGRLMAANGYRRGDLGRPAPDHDFFMYAYDWRDDLVASAVRLVELLDRLRRVRGEEILEVDLICQSAGGQICRYIAKYGGSPLAAVEAGGAGPSSRVRVAKAILVGTANGGSLRILRELDRGRSYVPAIGREMRPEVLFSFPSLFQDLPVYRDDLFVDGSGRPLDVDLFDPETWHEHGLSIFGADSRRRIERSGREDIFGDEADRRAAVARFLDRSRRLHEVLGREVEGFDSRYYSIQNVADDTPDRVVVGDRPDDWELLFTGDRKLRRDAGLHSLVTAPGDGHAAVASQRWLTPQELDAMALPPLHVRGDHFAMILDRQVLERILVYLTD